MKDFSRSDRPAARLLLAFLVGLPPTAGALGATAALSAEPQASGLESPGRPESSGPQTPQTPQTSRTSRTTAAYHFTLARLLVREGDLPGALAAFAEAERLAPGSVYVRLEHARALLALAQSPQAMQAARRSRGELLAQASDKADQARKMAPDNPDVLRLVAALYLDRAARDAGALEGAAEALEGVQRAEPGDFPSVFTLSRIYLERGKPEKAAAVLAELVAREPQQLPAYSLLAEALVRAGKPAEAEGALARILEIDPESAEARLMLAELQDRRGDYAAALSTLLATAPEDREDPRWRRQHARELYFTGDLAAARAALAPLLAAEPNDAQLSLLAGLVAAADGLHAESAAAFRKLLDARPGDASISVALARALARDGKLVEASRLLDGAAAELTRRGSAREAREVRSEQAQMLFEGRQWETLDKLLAELKAGLPQGARGSSQEAERDFGLEVDLLAADSLIARERYAEALTLLAAGSGAPAPGALSAPSVTARRAEALYRSGKKAEGEAALAELARRGDPPSVLAAVQGLQRLSKYQESIPLLVKIGRDKPETQWVGFLLGSAYERTGRHAEAVEEFRRTLAQNPDYVPALNYLGYLFAERGENLDEALRMTQRAVVLDPDNGAYVDSLGWVYFRMGKKVEARDLLERAVRLEPEDPAVHEHLGDVYKSLGEVDKARSAYERVLRLARDGNGEGEEDDDLIATVSEKLESLRRGSAPAR